MAHELDMSNGQANMAYVGETPWHGLGQELEAGASIEDWTHAAGLSWGVNRATVNFSSDAGIVLQMENRHVLYRNDTNSPLSVVSDSYKVVQPAQIMDFFRELTAKSDSQMETAGSLQDGKVIWALARMGKDFMIKDDAIAPYLMLATSYDMSTPTIAKLVATRVVCRNTIQIALDESDRRQIRIPHSTDFKAEEVRAGLDISLSEFEAFKQKAMKLANQSFSLSDMDHYLLKLLQPSDGEIDGDQIRKSKTYSKIIDLFKGSQLGNEQDAVQLSAWGALNAVTEYVDHQKGRNQSARLMDAWFLQGAKFKERALEILAA